MTLDLGPEPEAWAAVAVAAVEQRHEQSGFLHAATTCDCWPAHQTEAVCQVSD